MTRAIQRLTSGDLKRITPGNYADGGGLYLQITEARAQNAAPKQVSRSWLFIYTIARRTREMGLGSLSLVSLAEARAAALKYRKLAVEGIDPIETRKAERAERMGAAARTITFDECVAAYLAAHRDAWRNDKHAKQWDGPLRRSISPVLGKLPVREIDTAAIVKAIRPLWETTTTTAARVRGRIEAVLDWATVSGFREGPNPARWNGHLEFLLPAARKVAPVRHHAAMAYQDVPDFVARLRATNGAPARALEFLILTAVRSSEAREATWDEIDLTEKLWTIPGNRMKAGREHRVPLTPRALAIISAMQSSRGKGEFVFPGRSGGSVSESGFHYLMQLLGRNDVTVHGFRSAFRDWAGNETNHPREIAEAALAHRVGNEVELAYRRDDALEKRRRLMAAWEKHCATPSKPSAEVVPIRGRVDA
jgi:integrase